ncbi:MAG: exodeoxyribonuclease III [Patescibacteria group bacterium]
MRLYSWNVNGIRAVWNKEALQKFVGEHQPDILCIQETKANETQSPVELEGYEEVWHDGQRKGHFGTAVFTKIEPTSVAKGLPDQLVDKYNLEDDFGDTSKEGRVLTLEFEDFFIVTVYTPNSKRKLERLSLRQDNWDPAFLEYCKSLERDKPVLISGDLNVAHTEIDLARPKDNRRNAGFTDEERSGMDSYLSAGFVDTFRLLHPDTTEAYTWWSAWGNTRARNVGWRIDYWLASESLAGRIVDAQIHADVMGSDHCPVSIEIS